MKMLGELDMPHHESQYRARTVTPRNKTHDAKVQTEESVAPDTLVIFTQTEKRLGQIDRVARKFFKQEGIATRLIKPPIERKVAKHLPENESYPDGLNLVLIGHGGQGKFDVGKIETHNLNKLNLPVSLSSKVKHVYLLHCATGMGLSKIAEVTLRNREKWSSLKTISGNIFNNNWWEASGVSGIERKGWTGHPRWPEKAQAMLNKENDPRRSLDDFALKNPTPYNVSSIVSSEGYHRSYDVEEGKAKFAYHLSPTVHSTGAGAATRPRTAAAHPRTATARPRAATARHRVATGRHTVD